MAAPALPSAAVQASSPALKERAYRPRTSQHALPPTSSSSQVVPDSDLDEGCLPGSIGDSDLSPPFQPLLKQVPAFDPSNPFVVGATWPTRPAFEEDLAVFALQQGFTERFDGTKDKKRYYRWGCVEEGCPFLVVVERRRRQADWAFRRSQSRLLLGRHEHSAGGKGKKKKTAKKGEQDSAKKRRDEQGKKGHGKECFTQLGKQKRPPGPAPPSPVKTEDDSESDPSPPKKRRVDSATIKVAKGKSRAPPDSTSSVASEPSRLADLHAKKPSTVPSASASRLPPSSASASSARPQKSTSAKDTEVVMLSSDDEEEDVKPRASSVAIKPGTPPSASLSPALPASRRDDAPPEKPPTAELLALLHTLDPGGAWDFAEFFGNKLARGGITKPLALLKAAATSEKRTALMEELADDEKEGCWRRGAFEEALAEKVGG